MWTSPERKNVDTKTVEITTRFVQTLFEPTGMPPIKGNEKSTHKYPLPPYDGITTIIEIKFEEP